MSNDIKRLHIIPDFAFGEYCKCGKPATHKVEEVIDNLNIHPFSQYLCCNCFSEIFGTVAKNSCDIGAHNDDSI